jgi:hypothetical protein
MASIATIFNRVLGARAYENADPRIAVRERDDLYVLRSLPNEDVYFFVKDISNTRVVREADPRAGGACWKLIASAGVAVCLLIGVLLPSAYGLLAGYKVQSLRQEQQHLLTEKSSLELEEAKLLSPQRLEELARMQSFVDPAPQKVVYLDGKSGSLALNVK